MNFTEEVEKALKALRASGVILYPTDTVWGIGCDATNAEAVGRIFRIKARDDAKSLVVLASDMDMVSSYVEGIPPMAETIMEVSDKPVTIIYPKGTGLAWNVTAPDGSIAIRIPRHEFCQRLLKAFGKPIVSTSANISGDAAPRRFSEITENIKSAMDVCVDPAFEKSSTGRPSSIIMLGMDDQVRIIRE